MSPVESKPQSPSTGPRTAEGKARSSMNAMRHGLTGRVVVLPSEDMNVYRAFCEELMAELAPETALERQYAQTFCDTQWRLNRARSYEDSMLALGHFEVAGSIATEDPRALAALTAAKVFQANSKAFVNLSLYEQRLARQQKEALRQLEELQADRKAANARETKAEPAKSTPAHNSQEFVFSTPETGRAPHRRTSRVEDQNPLSRTEFPLEKAA